MAIAAVASGTSAAAAGSYRLVGRTVSRTVLAAGALGMALAVLVPRRAWRIGRLGVTAVHEGGHAVAAVLVGRKVSRVHLRADASGVTFHSGPAGRARRLVTAGAGYPAPGLVGLVGAFAISRGWPGPWLVVLLVLALINVVWWVRNLFGMLVMAVAVIGFGWLAWYGTTAADALVGAVVAWYLALGGLRASIEPLGDRPGSDAGEVGRILHLPVAVAKAAFVVSAGAAGVGVAGVLLAGW